jgi:hypothetical protein
MPPETDKSFLVLFFKKEHLLSFVAALPVASGEKCLHADSIYQRSLPPIIDFFHTPPGIICVCTQSVPGHCSCNGQGYTPMRACPNPWPPAAHHPT